MSNNEPPFVGRFWRVTPFGISLYFNTGYKTVAGWGVTKEEAIAWEAKMTAKEMAQNGNK